MPDIAPISLLILSDIHFGSMAAHPDFAPKERPPEHVSIQHQKMKAGLISAIKKLAPTPDAILVPGDLTSTSRPSEFVGCVELVSEIAGVLNLETDQVFYTFGNHDIDRQIVGLSGEPKTPAWEEGYAVIAAHAAQVFVPTNKQLIVGPVPGSGLYSGEKFNLLIANSGLFCTGKQKFPHGKLGTEQYNWILESLERMDDGVWKIVMVHHHPFELPFPTQQWDYTAMEEGAYFVEALANRGVDLVCHGHRHHPIAYTARQSNWHHPLNLLCAGSVAVSAHHRSDGGVPNTFHMVTLDGHDNSRNALGTVFTFEYSIPDDEWMPSRSKSIPIDCKHRFGRFVDDNEIDTLCLEVIKQATASSRKNIVQLPIVADLPIELQCIQRSKLNFHIKQAAIALGYKLIAPYSPVYEDDQGIDSSAHVVKPTR